MDKDITDSWQRSAQSLKVRTDLAPLMTDYRLKHHWQDSALRQAALAEHSNMTQLVSEGDMVAAIADTTGRLLWTAASNHMRTRAESVNFIEGGVWDESSAGTNAVGLSLALNKQGLTLNQLHASLYGDASVCVSTLKSELSRLRSLLGGCIGSRPYTLTLSVWADFLQIWKTLEQKMADASMDLYRGPLLSNSVSPELEEWRTSIDALVYDMLDTSPPEGSATVAVLTALRSLDVCPLLNRRATRVQRSRAGCRGD